MSPPRRLTVVEDAAELAEAAAQRLARLIEQNPDRVAICLTGGSTPKQLYELLATPSWRARIPWERTHWFIGDERFVPANDPNNNMGSARQTFLESCALPGTIHPIMTNAMTPDDAAHAYEADLQAFYGGTTFDPLRPLFDLVLMGIGTDGHTASLFPNYLATSETARWVVGVPQAHAAPFVPRVTMTFSALSSCREMLFLISGADKRAIVARTLADDTLPAARAHSQHETVWLLDRSAAPEGLNA